MTTPSSNEAKDLLTLAGRMGIPPDEALRQLALLIDLGPSVENILRTLCAAEVAPMTGS